MKIGIDIDEVVVEFVRGYLKMYEKRHGQKFVFEDIKSYNLWEVLDMTKEDSDDSINKFFETEDFDNLNLIEGAKEAIYEISKKNEIFFITSRPSFTKGKTKDFLKKHFQEISFELIHSRGLHSPPSGLYSQQKHKEEICLDKGVKIMIEDHYDFALKCAKNGTKVFLLDKPWNKGQEEHENIMRVKHWNEILEKLK